MSKPLFPSAVEEQSLSPAGEGGKEKEQNPTAAHDWLSNVSFKSHLVERVEDSFAATEHHRESREITGKRIHSTSKELHDIAKKKPKYKTSRPKDVDGSSSTTVPTGKHRWLEETGLKPEAAYCFDKKPDADNLVYNTLYRSHIATYRRCSQLSVGQSHQQEFVWDDGRNSKSIKHSKKTLKSSRYYSSQLVPSKLVLTSAQDSKHFNGKETSTECPLEFIGFSDFDTVEKENEDEENSSTIERYIGQKSAEYNKALSDNPHDVHLWLEFIEFQEKCTLWGISPGANLSSGDDTKSRSSAGDRRRQRLALIERKIAIFEKALEKNPIDTKLITGHMKLCEEVWEHEKIVKRWKDIVFRQPQNSDLWLGYLSYSQKHYSSFSTSSLISLYAKALSTLISIVEGKLVSHKPEKDVEEAMLSIFLNLCYFLYFAGHTEKAIANFQALVEFNFHCPDELKSLSVSLGDKIKYFEPFWDSGVPRFGEDGAKGWKAWFKEQQEEKAKESSCEKSTCGFLGGGGIFTIEEKAHKTVEEETESELSLIRGKDPHVAWGHLEAFREQEHFLPWRPSESDQEEPEDMDCVVLFDDISSFLFHLNKETSKVSLLQVFLGFVGSTLPPSLIARRSQDWLCTRILYTSQMFGFHNQLFGMMPFNAATIHPQFHYQSPDIGSSLQPMEYEGGLSSASVSFVHSTFNQVLALVSQCYLSQFACWWLFFEFIYLFPSPQFVLEKKLPKRHKHSVKCFERFAKALLKHPSCRNDVPLWCVYATLKVACGERKAALQVMETVCLQASHTSASPEDLYHSVTTYVELLLGTALSPTAEYSTGISSLSKQQTTGEDLLKAKHALICLAEGKFTPFSPDRVTSTLILKCERRLEEGVQEAVFSTNSLDNVNYTSARITAYAQCLYVNSTLKSLCKFFEEVQEHLAVSQRKIDEEQHLVDSVVAKTILTETQLLFHHSRHHPDPPSLMRGALFKGISSFPENPYFLSLFASFESHFMVVGKVRSYFNTHLLDCNTPTPWLVAISFEENRQNLLRQRRTSDLQLEELEMGVTHRIRSLYIKATQHSSGRHCPLLWRKYMTFELSQRGPKAAEAVYYQAVQQCPWVKVLYVDGATSLPDLGSKVIEMVEEKEIRLRAPIEEVELLQRAQFPDQTEDSEMEVDPATHDV